MSIQMGNDEFILYIRKRYPTCSLLNNTLGHQIWSYIQERDAEARKIQENDPCYWGNDGSFIDEKRLPKTATQFSFQRTILPSLYDFLDELGQK